MFLDRRQASHWHRTRSGTTGRSYFLHGIRTGLTPRFQTHGRGRGEARVREKLVRVWRGTQDTISIQRLADTYDTFDSLTCDGAFCWVLANSVHHGDKRAPASLQSLMDTLVARCCHLNACVTIITVVHTLLEAAPHRQKACAS
jgi:hypothetical protein